MTKKLGRLTHKMWDLLQLRHRRPFSAVMWGPLLPQRAPTPIWPWSGASK